jgi:hypothetical protein
VGAAAAGDGFEAGWFPESLTMGDFQLFSKKSEGTQGRRIERTKVNSPMGLRG